MTLAQQFFETYGVDLGDGEFAVTPGIAQEMAHRFDLGPTMASDVFVVSLSDGSEITVTQWTVH